MTSNESPNSKVKPKQKGLHLCCYETTFLGQIIGYLQQQPEGSRNLVTSILTARFLPFVVDRNSQDYRAIAIRCANECEAWGKAIREYAGLPPLMSNALTTINTNQDSSTLEADDTDIQLFQPQNKVDELHQMMFGDSFGN